MSRLQNKTSIPTILWVMLGAMFVAMMTAVAIVPHITGQENDCTIIAKVKVWKGDMLSSILLDPATFKGQHPLPGATQRQLDDWEFLVVQANNLNSPNGIHGGQTLLIPSPGGTDCSHLQR